MSIRSARPSLRGVLTAVICLAVVLTTAAYAVPPAELVAGRRAEGAGFPRVVPFGVAKAAGGDEAFRGVLRSGTVLSLDKRELGAVRTARPETMSLQLQHAGAAVVLDLVRVELFAPGFSAVTSQGEPIPAKALGEHYRGIVRGEAESLASISFFENEVAGFATSPGLGYLVLGRLEGDNPNDEHVLYPASALIPKHDFTCSTGDDGPVGADEVISYWDATRMLKGLAPIDDKAVPGANVKIYVEADNDLYRNKGSVAATTSYVTGLFSQSATLYSAESIPIVMSQLVVWDRRSPYKGNSSSALLSSFQKNRKTFNGDLGHLIALRGGGGIAAGFNGFCAPVRANSQCFSGIDPTYANVPTYSWTVMVFTHEMGHLMGSRHTHACVWNGNNTQIDGCYTPEGTCSQVAYPSGGGTVMSYCHLSGRPGINFNNGFGPQPGNVIRSRFAAASCLTP